jgi:hypothetical protein
MFAITFPIAGYFSHPIGRVWTLLQTITDLFPPSSMPKITIAKNNKTITREDNIGRPWQLSNVLSKSQATPPQRATEQALGL